MFRRFPNFIQLDLTDCGPTCLRIISKFYGKSFTSEFLRKLSFKSRVGTSLLGLSEAAEAIGFKTLGAKVNFDDLKDAPTPFIAFWNQEHFVVVHKLSKNKVHISDPAQGLVSFTNHEFLKNWATRDKDGIALFLEPTEEFYESDVDKSVENQEGKNIMLQKVFHHYMKYKKLLLQLLIGVFLASGLQLVFPFLTQSIIDVGITTKNVPFIYMILFAQLFVFIGRVSIDIIQRFLLIHVNSRINIFLLSEFFLKLLKLPIRYFDVKMTGDILQRLADHERVENFITRGVITLISSLLSIVVFGCVLLYYNFTIFCIFLASSFTFMMWAIIFLKKRAKIDHMRFTQLSQNNDKSIELIQGMQELKLNNAEIKKRWEWEYLQAKLFKVNLQSLNIEQIQNAGAFLINEFGNIIITFYAATLVINNELSLGMMLAISFIIGQINGPIIQLINILNIYQDAKLSMDRINEVHNQENETSNSESIIPLQDNADIEFKNVSFKYDESKKGKIILKDLNVKFEAGKVTAIVGESGSGKTTLMKLLLRIYDPLDGSIQIGNSNFIGVSHDDWRRRCGAVMQEGYLFDDTIINNIALGTDDIDHERVLAACETANIAEFINTMPLKFETKLGANGVNISTGQKQRILIARAIYKNPNVLLFDEATSALDARNEKEISEKLAKVFDGKTVIIIAHRLSTVRNADNIVVLEKGEITERGSHEELVDLKGKYFNLVKNQLELSA